MNSIEVTRKAQDVPRIDQGAAGDPALNKILDLRGYLRRSLELPSMKQLVADGEQTVDSAKDTRRRDLHVIGLLLGSNRIAHAGKDASYLDSFDLGCAQSTQGRIEFLTGTSERLPANFRFGLKSLGMLALKLGEVLDVKCVPVSRYVSQ